MNTIKIAFFWMLIGVLFVLHGYYEVSAIRLGVDVVIPGSTGEIPPRLHIVRIFLELFSFFLAVVTLQWFNKSVKWFSLVWSVLMAVANVGHFGMQLVKDSSDYTQVILLALILFINVLVFLELWKTKTDIKEA